MKHKAIALCRVSTARQRLEGHSLEAQETKVYEAADYWNSEITKIWSLDASSKAGSNMVRKDLLEALQYCKHSKGIKYFILDEVDRFMRSIEEYYWYKAEFRKLGVSLIFASQPELNEEGQLTKLLELLAVFKAESSNDERKKKTTDKMKARVASGYYPFPTPQGYLSSDAPGLKIPGPTRFELLKFAFMDVLSGSTPAEALRTLNSKGYVTPASRELDIDHFCKLLRSPFYAGIIQIDGWEINNHGLHQAMITTEQREALLHILDGRKPKFTRKKNNPEFPLSQTECTECGGKLVGFMHSNGKGSGWFKAKYRCRNCGKQHSRDTVHKSLSTTLNELMIDEAQLNSFLKALREVWKQNVQESIQQRNNLVNRLESLKDKKNKLVMSHAEAPEDLKIDIKDSIDAIKADITSLETEIKDAGNIEKDFLELVRFSLEYTSNLQQEWWELEHEERLRCKQLLFPAGFSVNYDQKVYTPEISTLYRFVSNKKDPAFDSESLLVELRGIAPRSESLHATLLQV